MKTQKTNKMSRPNFGRTIGFLRSLSEHENITEEHSDILKSILATLEEISADYVPAVEKVFTLTIEKPNGKAQKHTRIEKEHIPAMSKMFGIEIPNWQTLDVGKSIETEKYALKVYKK